MTNPATLHIAYSGNDSQVGLAEQGSHVKGDERARVHATITINTVREHTS